MTGSKVRPRRGHTMGRGKGWRKNLAPRKSIREQLGATRHEVYSWQALAQIPENIFDEFVEKVATRQEKGTIANALRYAANAQAESLKELRARAIERERGTP